MLGADPTLTPGSLKARLMRHAVHFSGQDVFARSDSEIVETNPFRRLMFITSTYWPAHCCEAACSLPLATAGSTTGAEFRLDGFPPEWYVISVTPSPQAVVTVGNPLTGGCNIAFASCQTGTAAVALLYSVQFYAANAVTQRVLSVHGHMHPSNSEFPCPMLVGCDEPCFCFGCSNGGTAAINYPGYCAVAVEPRSWTSVRALYR